jgi:hypothetical protein
MELQVCFSVLNVKFATRSCSVLVTCTLIWLCDDKLFVHDIFHTLD